MKVCYVTPQQLQELTQHLGNITCKVHEAQPLVEVLKVVQRQVTEIDTTLTPTPNK